MFERFTEAAREAVVLAQVEARGLRHGYIGTEHLVLGILGQSGTPGGRALERLGITLDAFRSDLVREIGEGGSWEKDQEALRSIGIDVDEVRRRVEEAFGPGALERRVRRRRWWRRRCEDSNLGPVAGHIPFTPRSKKVLELSLREAIRLGHTWIGTEHILLGIAREGECLAAHLLAARGASAAAIRQAISDALAQGGDSPGRSA
jgi:ATP-dependent Clp protease ATP-binding subunit ClpA